MQNSIAPILVLEGGLTAIAVSLAFCWPRAGSAWFKSAERAFSRLARRKTASVVVVGLSAFALRLALLPLFPIPRPFIHDDFSFLLAAHTFALGRLTNPTPAMWTHFESFHIDMNPTYMSMYFPAQGLLLAAGKVVTGHAWFGLLAVTALMCAAICWMLQAWLPPGWALLGGFLAVLRLGLFSYWINTYTGAGSVAALGGALVLGALPRLMKTARARYGVIMAVGIILLALSRPYEGMLLCIPVAGYLAWWIFFSKKRPPKSMIAKRAAVPLLMIAAAGAWMGYYNHRVFGSALTLPYTVNRATYAMAPYYVWQSPRSHPVYRHKEMRRFYNIEIAAFEQIRTLDGYLLQSFAIKPLRILVFYAGIALIPPLLMMRRVLLDKRIRFLVLCLPFLCIGLLIELFLIPHYTAPFAAIFYAVGLQAMRHLKVWRPNRYPAGAAIVRFAVLICVVMGAVRIFALPPEVASTRWTKEGWAMSWFGPDQLGIHRARVEKRLEALSGKQLAIVNYAPSHNVFDEWVYNAPDLDTSKVIWARDMGAAANQRLIDHYTGRTVWLVEPDASPVRVLRYSAALDDAVTSENLAASGEKRTNMEARR
jgi:hypothetical protein